MVPDDRNRMKIRREITVARTPACAVSGFSGSVPHSGHRPGVDQLLEVGGAETLPRSLAAVRPGGHLCLVGLLSGSTSDRGEAAKNQRGVRVDSVYVGSTQDLRDFCAFLEKSSLRPVIDRAFSFEEARGAYDYLQKQGHFGKVVIRL